MALHHEGLIYVMVMAAAADREMKDTEMMRLGDIVRSLPVFRDFDENDIPQIAGACADMLNDEDGLDEALAYVRESLPEKLRETAYAIACDVVAADGAATQEELRLLEMIRDELSLDRLIAAGIERGARARHMVA